MTANSIFLTGDKDQDIGLSLLDFLGGAKNGFMAVAEPLRQTLLDMLAVYSVAIAVLAAFIVLYHVLAAVVDAAQTGKAFRKINPFWAPLRLIVAIGLLVPLGSGLSTGQVLVLKLSAWGGNLASDFWEQASTEIATLKPLVVEPKLPVTLPLVRSLLLRDICVQSTNALVARAQEQAKKATEGSAPVAVSFKPVTVQPYNDNADGSRTTPYGWFERPYFCGAVTVFPPNEAVDGPVFARLKQAHIEALNLVNSQTEVLAADYIGALWGAPTGTSLPVPNAVAERYNSMLRNITGPAFREAVDQQLAFMHNQMTQDGWIGAAVYLDSILQMNVRLITVMNSLPQVDPPEIMLAQAPLAPATPEQPPSVEYKLYDTLKRFDKAWGQMPQISPLSAAGLGGISTLLSYAISVTTEVDGMASTGHKLRQSRELMRLNDYDWDSLKDVNPLAAMAAFGAYLTSKSVELLASAGVLNSIGPVAGPISVLITGLGLLAYVSSMALLLLLPLLPLIRFFIGVSVWLLQVVEALVAVPIIALAHLRAEDDGLAGSSAILGYILVLQVALRPVLMIFGLLGGLVVFLLSLALLNRLLLYILPGVMGSGQVGALWFMLAAFGYAVLALGLANGCFKLIDWLPGRVLPWLSGLLTPARPANQPMPPA
jgi:conjugal transfer/type IV secretion protein DotA/TraY